MVQIRPAQGFLFTSILNKQEERPSGNPGGFSIGANMEKSKENKLKDYKRTKDKIWVDKPTSINKRTSCSGVVFRGKYVEKRGDG